MIEKISTLKETIFCFEKLNVVFTKNIYQPLIDKIKLNFFETLEIFLAAVFLFITPDLATCIRIDWNLEKFFFALSLSFEFSNLSISLIAFLYFSF